MNNRDQIVLKKIVQYCDEIGITIKRFNLDFEAFSKDFVVKNAISMCVLQIGELAGKLSDEFKEKNNLMPWRDIKAMRNITAHNYGEIDVELLWETSVDDIEKLRNYCNQFII